MTLTKALSQITIILALACSVSCKKYDPKNEITLASKYAKKKKYYDAIRILDNVIRKDPKFAKAYARKAGYLWTLGKQDEALIYINKAIELDTICADCYSWRGSITKGVSSILDLNRSIELDDKDDKNFIARGQRRHELNDFYGAIEDFTRAKELSKSDIERANAMSLRGLSWLALGEYEKAKVDIDVSIWLDPTSGGNLHLRFLYHVKTGAPKDTLKKELEQCINLGLDTMLIRLANKMIKQAPN